MAELRIQSGTTSIVLPEYQRKYSQGWIDFEVKDRTINRTLVSDFVAFKRVFTISWPVVDGSLMAELLEIYLLKNDVTFYETQADLSVRSYICRLDIGREVLRDIEAGNFAFSGFSITLEEV